MTWFDTRPETSQLRYRVYTRRIGLRLSREQLAARCDCSSKMIQDYERGRSLPRADRLALLALALHTSTDHLVGLK